jgi:hypothetical protein
MNLFEFRAVHSAFSMKFDFMLFLIPAIHSIFSTRIDFMHVFKCTAVHSIFSMTFDFIHVFECPAVHSTVSTTFDFMHLFECPVVHSTFSTTFDYMHVFKYLLKNTMSDFLSVCHTTDINVIVYHSDSCIGQNRNLFVTCTSSHLYAISKVPQIKSISHKCLVSGHPQLKCDSEHGSIERKSHPSVSLHSGVHLLH